MLERAIGKVDAYFISNAPAGHFCYEYPAALKEQRKNFGAQVFFYRAQYLGGKMKFETRLYKDYAWIARLVSLLFLSSGMRMSCII
ncbi:hypothetical protein EON65_34875 [archaeon]|nr:MAG: hypothetical protein EON65_34875 [archaeon]